jgi:GNAT superfamily N-acetyltransferase
VSTDPRLSFRPAVLADSGTVISMVNAMADLDQMPRLDAEAQRRLLRDAFEKKRFAMILAEWEGKAVGYAAFYEGYSTFEARPTFFLDDLFVLSEYRGRHVGYELFRRCLREAKSRDCGRMEWLVLDANRTGLGFYDHLETKKLKGWSPFRLTREDIEKMAGS